MVRRSLIRAAAAVAAVATAVLISTSPALASATALVLPQSAAFAVLGHSCGGIQEQAYAAGFDATSGYPTGDVYLSTRCGGSGRGGGYHTTTYTAWAGATWDFTAAVVSDARLAAAPSVNPTLVAFDSHGNEVYNQSGGAYLVLAAGFVPAPRVVSVAPTSGPASGGTTVTIAGTGFTGVTGVGFGGVPAQSYTVVSSTSITATSPAASAGTVDVTVANAGGASATTAADVFTLVAAPVVSGLSPAAGPLAGGTAVTIAGAHFTGATGVSFGGTPAGFVVNSDTSITAYAPAGEAAETVAVAVTSIGGRSALTAADGYTYVAPTPPTVSSVSPGTGPVDGGTIVSIAGSGLTGALEVDFGGVPAAFTVNDDRSITAVAPAGAAGTVDVTVTGPGGTSAVVTADQFSYVAPVPVVTAVAPDVGPTAGGTLVTIGGSGLADALEVDFGGVPASFVVNGDTSITALAPAGAAGTVDVTVTSPGGTSAVSPADAFTFVDAPVVSAVSPNAGSVAGGDVVDIAGTGFTNAIEVDFGGVPATFVVNGDGSITAVTPAGAAGTVDVTVTGPGGTSAASAADQFTYG